MVFLLAGLVVALALLAVYIMSAIVSFKKRYDFAQLVPGPSVWEVMSASRHGSELLLLWFWYYFDIYYWCRLFGCNIKNCWSSTRNVVKSMEPFSDCGWALIWQLCSWTPMTFGWVLMIYSECWLGNFLIHYINKKINYCTYSELKVNNSQIE